MDRRARKPLYSILDDSADLEDSIHAFVIGLAEQVDLLQDDEQSSDYESLEERAVLIADEADRMGYPEFARAVQKVAQACGDELKDVIQKGLFDVTELARCIRQGHRGAA
ncbi:MAG: hypothetical protein P8Q97_08720 [Myxococcota bacterium]|jgi:hypothetical protein|nr:hypothetical protein [Myxococcota bacterium]